MSELINNKKKMDENFLKRQQLLKELILKLHDGESEEDVHTLFKENFSGVSSYEITQMEQSLMQDEGLEVDQIQKLCSIHANIFKGSIDEVHTVHKEEENVGHPVRVLREENYAIRNLLDEMEIKLNDLLNSKDETTRFNLIADLALLWDIDKHYTRKENTIFPLMEKHGIMAPPKVMWAVDDDIRKMIKDFRLLVEDKQYEKLQAAYIEMANEIKEMIFKEEDILIPMVLEIFTEDEWLQIAEDSIKIGYCIVAPDSKWYPTRKDFVEQFRSDEAIRKKAAAVDKENIHFDIGFLNKIELESILNKIPIDITFIDADDTVKYFNQAEERFFARVKSVIGRTVQNCHPPHSVNTVESILNDFKSGAKDTESFWIDTRGAFLHISYYAIRDENNKYLGTLEVTQNIKSLRELEGEKRLLED